MKQVLRLTKILFWFIVRFVRRGGKCHHQAERTGRQATASQSGTKIIASVDLVAMWVGADGLQNPQVGRVPSVEVCAVAGDQNKRTEG